MAVTDASVITSVFSEYDANHVAAREWYEGARSRGERILAPSILLAEVAAAFSRTLNDPHRASVVVDEIVQRKLIELVPVVQTLALRAAEVTQSTRLKGCDAIYVALAAELDDVLVTFDQEQLIRTAGIIRVVRPA